MVLTFREKFIAVVDNDTIMKSDAIVLLQGDGFYRVPKTLELWKAGYASAIVISGGALNQSYGSFNSEGLRKKLIKGGVPSEKIIIEGLSRNTYEQAKQVVKLAAEHNWKSVILVASHYHQYRAYLTFLKAVVKSRRYLHLINIPSRNLSWFKKEPWGKRIELLEEEFRKIDKYRKLGHTVSYKEAIDYQKKKEKLAYSPKAHKFQPKILGVHS